jgi:hypothetical protein
MCYYLLIHSTMSIFNDMIDKSTLDYISLFNVLIIFVVSAITPFSLVVVGLLYSVLTLIFFDIMNAVVLMCIFWFWIGWAKIFQEIQKCGK